MTNTVQNPSGCTSGDHKHWSPYSLEVEAELEKLDREAGHDYVPMDIFIDRWTMKEHFQDSSIRARWAGIHSAPS
jgi:hypothetical protein